MFNLKWLKKYRSKSSHPQILSKIKLKIRKVATVPMTMPMARPQRLG